ncbi:hypothetical protein GBAR_LOCUS16144, partial [Geodia barretti]
QREELGAWASVFSPDKEGLLEKKGYKERWFRLKGNLLFYIKVDELGAWEVRKKPNQPLLYWSTTAASAFVFLAQTVYTLPSVFVGLWDKCKQHIPPVSVYSPT